MPEEVLEELTIHAVDKIDKVLELVLEDHIEEVIIEDTAPVWKTDTPSTEISTTIE